VPNSKYSQVTDLLAAGRLRWDVDQIEAHLLDQGTFDAAHTTLSQVGTSLQASPIQGRWVAPGGNLMGQPAFFQSVEGDKDYRVAIVQNIGNGDPNLLAWYDTDELGEPLHLDNGGSLIIRPTALEQTPEGSSSTSRLWMKA
jgi:hypothetical protein